MEDLDECDRLTNRDAVLKILRKVMRSITGCQGFLTTLREMPQYTELATFIRQRCEQNRRSTTLDSHTVQPTTGSQQELPGIPTEEANDPANVVQITRDIIQTLRNSRVPNQISPAEAIPLRKCVGKHFTEFMMYVITLFQRAIENNTITLKSSKKREVIDELTDHFQILSLAKSTFASTENNGESLYNSVELVVRRAMKVRDIVKSLQKIKWLSFYQSAKIISTLVPIFEKINHVVSMIRQIDCRPLSVLLGSIADLDANLDRIKQTFNGITIRTGITSIIFAVSGGIFLIVGAILSATGVSSPVGVPLMCAGGSVMGVAGTGSLIATFCAIAKWKCIPAAITNGHRIGQEYTKNFQSELFEQSTSN